MKRVIILNEQCALDTEHDFSCRKAVAVWPDVICRPAILEKMKKENYQKEQQVVDTMVEKAPLEILQQTYSQGKCNYASILPKDCNILTKRSLAMDAAHYTYNLSSMRNHVTRRHADRRRGTACALFRYHQDVLKAIEGIEACLPNDSGLMPR